MKIKRKKRTPKENRNDKGNDKLLFRLISFRRRKKAWYAENNDCVKLCKADEYRKEAKNVHVFI